MKMNFTEEMLWKALFAGLLPIYILYYAPCGMNETDGGFLSGLAWQVLQGKTLYHDIIYVRPPLPVWLRALEIKLLPADWSVLGERWIFYLKVWIYAWMGAALLSAPGKSRWQLAVFGFLVSVHCYPAMAWHTVDGIFFSVCAAWLLWRPAVWPGWAFLSGIALFGAVLCKQSFYPLPLLFALGIWLDPGLRKFCVQLFAAGFLAAALSFSAWLLQNHLFAGFLNMTGGAADSGQALEHGVLDYFRITPELAIPSLVWIGLIFIELRRKPQGGYAAWMYALWLAALVCSYGLVTWFRQDHTVPFAQSRVLFWQAGILILLRIWRERKSPRTSLTAVSLVLLGISWSAALSWGFSLPLLFAVPWVWTAIETGKSLAGLSGVRAGCQKAFEVLMLVLVLAVFRIGYEFVYRDGRRKEMTVAMEPVFHQLTGIYSDAATARRYLELKNLSEKYGPDFTVLPAFPQANFLTGSYPPLPLDWVVNRETNGRNELIFKCLREKSPVIFLQNEYLDKCPTDPELTVTNWVLNHSMTLEKGDHFTVVKLSSE